MGFPQVHLLPADSLTAVARGVLELSGGIDAKGQQNSPDGVPTVFNEGTKVKYDSATSRCVEPLPEENSPGLSPEALGSQIWEKAPTDSAPFNSNNASHDTRCNTRNTHWATPWDSSRSK